MPTTDSQHQPSKEVNFRLDLDALEILERYAARVEERQRFQERRQGGLKDDDGEAA